MTSHQFTQAEMSVMIFSFLTRGALGKGKEIVLYVPHQSQYEQGRRGYCTESDVKTNDLKFYWMEEDGHRYVVNDVQYTDYEKTVHGLWFFFKDKSLLHLRSENGEDDAQHKYVLTDDSGSVLAKVALVMF